MTQTVHGLQVLPISAVCTRQDIQQAELWLASAIDLQSDQPRLASDSLQEVASQLQQTGVPAFLHEELPQLCDAILEALHSSSAFYGCLTQGMKPETLPQTLKLCFYLCLLPCFRSMAFLPSDMVMSFPLEVEIQEVKGGLTAFMCSHS